MKKAKAFIRQEYIIHEDLIIGNLEETTKKSKFVVTYNYKVPFT